MPSIKRIFRNIWIKSSKAATKNNRWSKHSWRRILKKLRRAKKLEIKCTKNHQNRFSSWLSRNQEEKWPNRIRCQKRRASRSTRSTKSHHWRTFLTANRRQSSYKSLCSSITFSTSRRMIWPQATAHPSWMSRKFSSRQKLSHSVKMLLQIRFKIRTKVKSYNK